MSSIKFYYFGLRGRGEVSRLVLYAAGKDFDDVRVEFSDWADLKPKTPFGSLPYLEVDGASFGQSQALSTYLAREFGLYGSTNIDGLKIEQIHQLREDLLGPEIDRWREKDATKKAELTKKLNEETYPKVLGLFEKLIKENKEGSKYSVGDKLSLADIVIYEGTQTLRQTDPSILDNFPLVKAVAETVAAVEGVSKYVATRAQSDL